MSTWKEAAEKWEASLPRGVTITVQQIFQAGAEHGYEVGNIEADTQWSEKVLELEAANIQLNQQIAEHSADKVSKYMAEAIALEKENAKLKAEVESLRAYGMGLEKTNLELLEDLDREREANAKLREALESISYFAEPKAATSKYWLSSDKASLAEIIATDTRMARKALLAAKQECGCQTSEYPYWSRITVTDGVKYCSDCDMAYTKAKQDETK